MSALVNNTGLSDDKTTVTKISANARIDYILRFSKQAILVINESTSQNVQFSSQFLATIPENHNAAYIPLSAQFNDIQIRCRIIEQLSAGELFDPELSLAVSVINLAKNSQQEITIVLDNAQHLSLQVFHEVSQLTAIAKKANLAINVVMFGSVQAGRTIKGHKELFLNKLVLLSAQSGQLLSTSAGVFQGQKVKWYMLNINKWLFAMIALLMVLSATVLFLLQQDTFNFSLPLKNNTISKVSLAQTLNEPQPTVINDKNESEINIAATEDVYLSLIGAPKTLSELSSIEKHLPASPLDVMQAMSSSSSVKYEAPEPEKVQFNTANLVQKSSSTQDLKIDRSASVVSVHNNYYKEKEAGFVIQIAAFSEESFPQTFLNSLTGFNYHIYKRSLNNRATLVVTSQVYPDKLSAVEAISILPKSILMRQPWIKSLRVVNNEINAFQGSQ